MKVIGYQAKGNLVRFYLGDNDCKPTYPPISAQSNSTSIVINSNNTYSFYMQNGVYPYADYIKGYKDFIASWKHTILSVDQSFCINMDELKKQLTPIVVVAKANTTNKADQFNLYKSAKDSSLYYLFDDMEPDSTGLPEDYPENYIGD